MPIPSDKAFERPPSIDGEAYICNSLCMGDDILLHLSCPRLLTLSLGDGLVGDGSLAMARPLI
jgi:hypothetical protein